MTQLAGRFEDAGGNALTGTLRATLDTAMVDQGDSPDSIVTRKPVEFAIAGDFTVEVPESQTNQVTYHFEFFQIETSYRFQFEDGTFYDGLTHLHTDGQYYTGPVQTVNSVLLYRITDEREVIYSDFHAQVPNVASVEFAQLAPTGITRDTLDTSIARLAELLSTVSDYVERLRGGPLWQGAWSDTAYYSYGQAVSYAGASWFFLNTDPQIGSIPSLTNSDWQLIAAKGEAGTLGDDTAYDEVGWDGDQSPPTKNAVRDLVEALPATLNLTQYAPKASPELTGTPTTATPVANSNNTQIANTVWVRSGFAPLDSPNLTGNPSTTVPAPTDDSGRIAPTSWVRETATSVAQALVNAVATLTIRPTNEPQIHRLTVLGLSIFFGRVSFSTPNNLDYIATLGLPVTLSRFLAGVASPSNTTGGDSRVLGSVTVTGDANSNIVQILARNNINTTPITTQVSFVVFGTV